VSGQFKVLDSRLSLIRSSWQQAVRSYQLFAWACLVESRKKNI
jgi:hypothetical protein